MNAKYGEERATLPRALRLLGRLWLSELRPEDVAPIQSLPYLGPALDDAIRARGGVEDEALLDLAVEHNRLFGIEMPPYESVFVDPSGMLGAPAAERVAARLERAGWRAPSGSRAAAPDHMGLELLALGDLLESGAMKAADGLVGDHLALWAPPLVLGLKGLGAHPVYCALGELTLEVVLKLLSGVGGVEGAVRGSLGLDESTLDPFPELPPAPRYRGSEDGDEERRRGERGGTGEGGSDSQSGGSEGGAARGHRSLARQLTITREAGLYLSRPAIRSAARSAGLPAPGGAGDRMTQVVELLRAAEVYDVRPALLSAFGDVLSEMEEEYRSIARRAPQWRRYADGWCERLDRTRAKMWEDGSRG